MTKSICLELFSGVTELDTDRFHHGSTETRALGIPPKVPISARRSHDVCEISQNRPRY
ncbi:hypothetical protein P3T31_003858 [Rhizobium sp. AN70]|nr:hypothetical protein [Rhizobium sp. AN70]